MVSPGQTVEGGSGYGDVIVSRPQIGTVGFVIGTRSLCIYTPLGWIDVEVRPSTSPKGFLPHLPTGANALTYRGV